MSKYYLLMDYLVPMYINHGEFGVSTIGPIEGSRQERIRYYQEHPDLSIPKSRAIVSVDNNTKLYICYFDVDVGHFLIKAQYRKAAYDLACILRGLFILFFGWQPDERTGYYFLQEFKRIPQPEWDADRLISELIEAGLEIENTFAMELRQGYKIMYEAFRLIPQFVSDVWGKTELIDAMNHMLESRFLFCGFMVGSYYALHYTKDRMMTPKWEMEKRYFENKYRYETAFVAAFKGIERFFSVNDIKKHDITSILSSCTYTGIAPNTKYTRYHEIFSGHAKNATYEEMLSHFLRIRNTVAAHGNKKPPYDALIIEDNVFEIQLFLMELLSKSMFRSEY